MSSQLAQCFGGPEHDRIRLDVVDDSEGRALNLDRRLDQLQCLDLTEVIEESRNGTDSDSAFGLHPSQNLVDFEMETRRFQMGTPIVNELVVKLDRQVSEYMVCESNQSLRLSDQKVLCVQQVEWAMVSEYFASEWMVCGVAKHWGSSQYSGH
jgi:hypothetical protein